MREGPNLITALVENEGYSHVFPVFHVGPASDLARAYGWGGFLNVDLPLAAIAILIFTALLCLMVNWPEQDRRRVNALIVLLLVWALRDWSLVLTPPFAMSKLVFWVVFWTLSFAIIFASVRYVLRDAGAPAIWMKGLDRGWIAAQLLCFGMPLFEGRIGPDAGTWFRLMTQVELWLTLALGGGAMLLLARTYEQREVMTQRQTVLEERQRIVRDMHDGIGGRLVGLILQVRNRAIDAEVRRRTRP